MKESGRIAAVILAAGYSSRMGALKPLLPVGRSTAVEEAVTRFRAAGIGDIRVVVGYQSEEIVPIVRELGVRTVFNEKYDEGMLSSVLAGLESLEPYVEAFFLLPCDMPLVKPATIASIAQAYGSGGPSIVYPCFLERRGHPPLIATSCLRDLSKECQGGLRAFLSRFEDKALELDVVDEAIVMDCDTPDEYKKLQAYGLRQDVPTERECEALWARYNVSADVAAHCRLVSGLARTFAVRLNEIGFDLDTELVAAGGFLHDLAKGQPDHAHAGAEILEGLGYPKVARIVASHTDIRLEGQGLDETALVHLADKYVRGDQFVTLEERFAGPLRKFVCKPHILKAVERRREHARIIRDRLEKLLGISVEDMLRKCGETIRTAADGGKWRQIYLVRHGAVELEGNGRRYIGQLDVPLSSEGVRQAEALRERLRHVSFEAVFCSDLTRSIQTAGIIASVHGIEPRPNRRLREIALGEWEGRLFDEVRRLHPAAYEERGRDLVHFRPPGGESFLDCAERVTNAFHEVLHSTSDNILIVGHAGVNRILICRAMGKPMETLMDIRQDYGCLNLVRYRGSTFRPQIANETAHLREDHGENRMNYGDVQRHAGNR